MNTFQPTYPGSRLAGMVIHDRPKAEKPKAQPKPVILGKLTRRDVLVLGYVKAISELGDMPTQEEAAKALGMKRRTYRWYLERLEAHGLIQTIPAKIQVAPLDRLEVA